jgi:hypothetical protein
MSEALIREIEFRGLVGSSTGYGSKTLESNIPNNLHAAVARDTGVTRVVLGITGYWSKTFLWPEAKKDWPKASQQRRAAKQASLLVISEMVTLEKKQKGASILKLFAKSFKI